MINKQVRTKDGTIGFVVHVHKGTAVVEYLTEACIVQVLSPISELTVLD